MWVICPCGFGCLCLPQVQLFWTKLAGTASWARSRGWGLYTPRSWSGLWGWQTKRRKPDWICIFSDSTFSVWSHIYTWLVGVTPAVSAMEVTAYGSQHIMYEKSWIDFESKHWLIFLEITHHRCHEDSEAPVSPAAAAGEFWDGSWF